MHLPPRRPWYARPGLMVGACVVSMCLLAGCGSPVGNRLFPTETLVPVRTATAFPPPAPTHTIVPTQPPSTPTPTRGVVQAAPTPTAVTYTTRERLALYHEVWEIVNENYVYPDFNGVDWAALEHAYDDAIRTAPDTAAFYAIIQSVVDRLDDDHTRFDTPQQTFADDEAYTGAAGYAGIGVMLRDLDDSVLVIRVGRDGPAERAGIRVYDRIVAVDGRAVTDFYTKNDDYGAAVRGAVGTTVTLTILRQDARLDIPIVRNAIPGDAFPEASAEIIPGTRVALLTIDTFNREHLRDLIVAALADAKPTDGPVSGLIIDVRENTGGEVSAMLQTIGLFVDGGAIGTSVGRSQEEPVLVAPGDVLPGHDTIPIVVLIGPGSVSAAEMFASGMHSLRRATLVGETTAGNTENLYPYEFDDGSVLWLAEILFRQNDGTYIDNIGVVPDITVPESTEPYDRFSDPVIQAALATFPVRKDP